MDNSSQHDLESLFLDFYKLRGPPFGATPDPHHLYLSRTHREALASLLYGIETGRGFLALIAGPGMGKTTLLFRLLEHLRRSARTVFLFQTQCNARELLRYLLADLGVDTHEADLAKMHQQLNGVLVREMRARRRFVLVIDEAQNLDAPVLETVRLLSNFETPQTKLMQIILAGQPQLATTLAQPTLTQLHQRIAVLSRLDPFTPTETAEYIDHQLRAAGKTGGRLFTPAALAMIQARSQGIPRTINNICFNALSMGYALGQKTVDSKIVSEVLEDLALDTPALKTEPFRAPPSAQVPPKGPLISCGVTAKRDPGLRAFRSWLLAALVGLAGILSFSYSVGLRSRPQDRRPLTALHAGTGSSLASRAMPAEAAYRPSTALQTTLGESERPASPPGRSNPLTIVVKPHQTLRHICLRYVGRFDSKVLEEILELNPQLTDPNRIEVGQRLRLPAVADVSRSDRFAAAMK